MKNQKKVNPEDVKIQRYRDILKFNKFFYLTNLSSNLVEYSMSIVI